MKRTYVDCTSLLFSDLNTGIQRVESKILKELVECKVCIDWLPVVFDGRDFYKLELNDPQNLSQCLPYWLKFLNQAKQPWRLKRFFKILYPFGFFEKFLERFWNSYKFILMFVLGIPSFPVIMCTFSYSVCMKMLYRKKKWIFSENDIFLMLGETWYLFPLSSTLKRMNSNGVDIISLVYDLIPIRNKTLHTGLSINFFEKGIESVYRYSSLLLTISDAVRVDILEHQALFIKNKLFCKVEVLRLGVDLQLGNKSDENISRKLLACFSEKFPVFICVGSLVPRKNHTFLLDAFDELWMSGIHVRLLIIGVFQGHDDSIVERIKSHRLLGDMLFWYDDINDAELTYSYRNAEALIFPSISEGFGLPLIEALRYECNVFASDIPVFREVGREYCHYFSLCSTSELKELVVSTLSDNKSERLSPSAPFDWPTWNHVTQTLIHKIALIGNARE